MVRKKCALVACVRVCAQNISREEWFSVPSRTGHPPAHQQKYCPSRGKSKDVGLHFKIIVCVSLKNVIRPPTLPTKKKMLSVHPPTYQQKMLSVPPTYQQKNVIRLHFKIIVCVSLKMLSVHLPTNLHFNISLKKMLSVHLPVCVSLLSVHLLPTKKCYPSLPTNKKCRQSPPTCISKCV